jgi:hypothetical protein
MRTFKMKTAQLVLALFLSIVIPSTADAQAKHVNGSISDMKFIAGNWKAKTADRTIDAVWSSPLGENIIGYVRVMKDDQPILYELFAFEQSEHGLVALVKHFKPGLLGMEEKDKCDRYTFLEAGDGRALFEKEGGLVRVLYERRPGKQFAVVVGKQEEGTWVFKDFWQFTCAE